MGGHEVLEPQIPEEEYEEEERTSLIVRLYWSYGWVFWIVALIAAVVLLSVLAVTLSNRDDRTCRAHGHQVVATGIGDGEACVDSEWKLVRP